MKNEGNLSTTTESLGFNNKIETILTVPIVSFNICLLLAQSMMASVGTWSPLPTLSLISATKPVTTVSHGCFSKEIYQPSRWWYFWSVVVLRTNRRWIFILTHKKLDMLFPVVAVAAECLIQRPQQQWFTLSPYLYHGIKGSGNGIICHSATFWTTLSRWMRQSCMHFLNVCLPASKK